jgi:hypothetical protein
MFRTFRAMIYNTVVGAIHDAFSDTGFIAPDAHGTLAEQVRAAIHGPSVEAIAAPTADEDADKPRTRAKGGAK